MIKNVLLDDIQNLVLEKFFMSYPITYSAKWDSIQTSVTSAIQNLKEATFESSCSKQSAFEKNSVSVVSSQQILTDKQK